MKRRLLRGAVLLLGLFAALELATSPAVRRALDPTDSLTEAQIRQIRTAIAPPPLAIAPLHGKDGG